MNSYAADHPPRYWDARAASVSVNEGRSGMPAPAGNFTRPKGHDRMESPVALASDPAPAQYRQRYADHLTRPRFRDPQALALSSVTSHEAPPEWIPSSLCETGPSQERPLRFQGDPLQGNSGSHGEGKWAFKAHHGNVESRAAITSRDGSTQGSHGIFEKRPEVESQ